MSAAQTPSAVHYKGSRDEGCRKAWPGTESRDLCEVTCPACLTAQECSLCGDPVADLYESEDAGLVCRFCYEWGTGEEPEEEQP